MLHSDISLKSSFFPQPVKLLNSPLALCNKNCFRFIIYVRFIPKAAGIDNDYFSYTYIACLLADGLCRSQRRMTSRLKIIHNQFHVEALMSS